MLASSQEELQVSRLSLQSYSSSSDTKINASYLTNSETSNPSKHDTSRLSTGNGRPHSLHETAKSEAIDAASLPRSTSGFIATSGAASSPTRTLGLAEKSLLQLAAKDFQARAQAPAVSTEPVVQPLRPSQVAGLKVKSDTTDVDAAWGLE